ncbi:hybrid sensor histidine kinase/response regulator [Clostridium sp. DJ247]|uniref:hybrid sensor histidine kinase/response regulator n=1 Tax=Clostridium sp. DJ247 TaxID=2726188 RepID=UPI0016242F8E|nr:hybrid sensor histidine kinase/response regulator [Clostridium sp. DJ247]MBC2580784.1 hybrid sensor histidine kinase/response regulator [Clostridium sp. DJ247]
MVTNNLYTILVVDDNLNNLFTANALIREYIDANVLLADTPAKALQELIKHSVDLIILDVHMEKEMDGFELARIIKSRKKTEHIPIVFLTAAYIGEDFKRKGFEIGAVDYLTKPIDDFLLINRINTYLRLIKKERSMNILLQEQTKELKRAKEAAEAANEAKNMFLANVSHELRTPLNILFGSTQIIEQYLKNDEVLDREKIKLKVKTQTQNCYRLIRLVNNLIDITKIDSGNFTLNISICDIIEVVEAIVTSVVEYAALKNIEVTFDTDVEELILSCDLDAIERIVLNLLSNAIKFTPQGGNIFVNIITLDNSIEIRVKDSGIGISQDKHQVIFERFKQVDNLLTRSNEGSGIGLSLVKSLVEMHGGNIKVKSEHLKGSEFIVEIPICEENKKLNAKKDSTNKSSNVIHKSDIEFSDIYF